MENNLDENILLSIIIPTKNRQPTCIYAIGSVVALGKNDVEVIVQDCSDSAILKQQIEDKFGDDARIKYEYVDTKPSMTDNWNRAYERATGFYQCGIGDDDIVLPDIYEVAQWAKENEVGVVGHSKKFNYFWPDYTVTPHYASHLVKNILENPTPVKIYLREDLDNILMQQATHPDMNYRRLPMVYHALVSGEVIRSLITKTGKFLDGTSLDVYSAFALGIMINKFYVLDKPFTLPGACGSSNSNRSTKKNFKNHFAEYATIETDQRIPQEYNLLFTIVESTQKALKNLGDTRFSRSLDLPVLYAGFLSESFNLRMHGSLRKLMKEQQFTSADYNRFYKISFSGLSGFLKRKVRSAVNMGFIKKILTKRDQKNVRLYPAKDIFEARDIIPSAGQ